ncbi:MAG TPA: MMPL family transporter [Gaiellaceae bacterium]
MTAALARVCARHPWRTIAGWLIAAVVGILLAGSFLGGRLSSQGQVTSRPASIRANDLLDQRFPAQAASFELVVVRSPTETVDSQAFRAEVSRLENAGRASKVVSGASVYYANHDPALVSSDRHALLIPITLTQKGVDDNASPLVDAVKRFDGKNGFSVTITGEQTTNYDFNHLSQHDLESGELQIGLPAAILVLLVVFGAVVAASLPLILAIVSIAAALGLTTLLALEFNLSIFLVNMLTGMGLALGIDYALFVSSRFREERAHGKEKAEAIASAGATASKAVLFSGTSFVLAMLGLLMVQSTIMRSLAVGAILVGVVAVAAALTLLPAILSLLGDRINRLRIPIVGKRAAEEAGQESPFWDAIVHRVMRRPLISFVAVAALLLAAASPLFGMNIGASGISTFPKSAISRQGFAAVSRYFPQASAEPAQVVIDGHPSSPPVKAAIGKLKSELAQDHAFGKALLAVNPAGNLGVLNVSLTSDPLGDLAIEAVKRLRSTYVPQAFAGTGVQVLVTGNTAENIDYFDVMSFWLPIELAVVLGLSFLLLTVAFRSIVVPATAIVLNLLSVGASYGLLVLVFQHGVGAGLFGFHKIDVIEAWVPLFLFAVLFGLSMDYQVFLLSRIRERFTSSGDTSDAVGYGIGSTARLITGAALIIVTVFIGFAAGDLVMFQQMGFGIAVALLIDATLVRSVLLPAAMQMLGRRNWYLPRWLGWIPRISVEGEAAAPARPAAPQP